MVDADISSVSLCPAWVTVIVFVRLPDEIVMVAVLLENVVFAVAVTVIVLLPLPDEDDTVHQVWEEERDHSEFDVILNVAVEAADWNVTTSVDISNDAPDWATVTVLVKLPALMVRVAVLDSGAVFAAADTVTVRLPLPEEGDAVHHD
jgi:hypothetical protein